MQAVVLIGLGLAAIYLFGRWAQAAGPVRTRDALRYFAIAGAAVALGLAAARSRGAALLLLPLLAPYLLRYWQRRRTVRDAGGNVGGEPDHRQSSVTTRYLRMNLEHASGKLSGAVLVGRYAGRELDDLMLAELLSLLAECADDPQSVAVLESYLDHRDSAWRAQASAGEAPAPRSGPMTREEALAILGLRAEASNDEVVAAHRRLMQRLHPDHGGSDFLAAKINEAKQTILNGTKNGSS